MKGIWAELGIARGSDRDTIRRAYAKKLRVTNPEDDAEGFKRLRAAYEGALAQADYAARWSAEDEEANAQDAADDVFADDLPRPDPSQFWQDPAPAPAPSDEAHALLADRDSDLAALRAKMGDLESALRGIWRAPDDEMARLFALIFSAPALGEIAVREDVERWAARLIADTIPRSDAVLAEAVSAFGWSDRHGFGGDYAVNAVLARLEEWRLIATLGKPVHTLHAAWSSLTTKPGWHPWWRLKAMTPGLAQGVRTLLGDFGAVSPGLHFSFDTTAVARWRAYLAKPRLSYAMAALAFATWIGVHFAISAFPQFGGRVPYALGGVVAVLSLAAPGIALLVERKRHAREQAERPESHVLHFGWAPAFAALGVAAILLPASPWAALAVTLLGLILLGWIVVAPDPLAYTAAWPALGRWMIAGWAYGLLGIVAAGTLAVPVQLVLGVMAVLSITVRATMVEQVRRRLHQIAPQRPWLVATGMLGGVVMLGLLATAGRLILNRGGDADRFTGAALTVLIVLPGLALLGPHYRRWTTAAHFLVFIAFATVAVPLLPASPPSRQSPGSGVSSSNGSSASVPLTREVDQARVMKRVPVLARMRDTNPATYAAIQQAIDQHTRGHGDDAAMWAAINGALNAAADARLPDAPAALVMEDRQIVLAQFRALRSQSPAACARGDLNALKTVPEPLRERTSRFVQDVAATPLATASERKAGQKIDPAGWTAGAAKIIGRSVPDLIALLGSKAETMAVCDARIAMMQSLVSHREADVAATMRALRTKKAASGG